MASSNSAGEQADISQPPEFSGATRPYISVGHHDSNRFDVLSEELGGRILKTGFNFITAPITNCHFRDRVVALYKSFVEQRAKWATDRPDILAKSWENVSLPRPILAPLTDRETTLAPLSSGVGWGADYAAYSSPWIDICANDPLIAGLSCQALNLEVAYANFCGYRNIIIPGPRQDGNLTQVAHFARAVHEAEKFARRSSLVVQLPMYREPGLADKAPTLSSLCLDHEPESADRAGARPEIDLFGAWDTWNIIRTCCDYSARVFVGLYVPRQPPIRDLQNRWFAEPIHNLTFVRDCFQENTSGYPSLSRHHQDIIKAHMRLKCSPCVILQDVGPSQDVIKSLTPQDFPTPAEAQQIPNLAAQPMPLPANLYAEYIKHVEDQQEPYSSTDSESLRNFQDWLQAPLQPLADNLESIIYETFEGDPVKYERYEQAIYEAMVEWKELKKPVSYVSSGEDATPELVMVVAGAGRGPLVARAMRAAKQSGTAIQLWALEKNHHAFVYLLQRNEREWGGRVKLVRTDMRSWPGPTVRRGKQPSLPYKVDILITELLGSFGDNELSPECLDGIQRHLARPQGISIPSSYTAHLSPVCTPRLYADILGRARAGDGRAYQTPWVVRLFSVDFVAQRAPDHPRFQEAWRFDHPVPVLSADELVDEPRSGLDSVGGVGSMLSASGLNEHNTRRCHLTFVCRTQGVIHGLAGFFEAVLYEPRMEGKEKIEISTVPDQMARKSPDMFSWFPILFPIERPLNYPPDTELEVSMWRQTDDSRVWYEWMVTAYTWIGPNKRIKVGFTAMHDSRHTACLMQCND